MKIISTTLLLFLFSITALAIGTSRTERFEIWTTDITNGDLTLTPNGSGDVIISSGTATTVPYLDASKQLISSSVTPTELGYVSGVTSAIQTQVDAKEGTLTNSAGLLAALNDETGTGLSVFSTSGTLTTPVINSADANFGTASNSVRLLLPNDTTTNLDALTDTAGLFAYDTTLGAVVFNDGTGWTEISGGGGGSRLNLVDQPSFETDTSEGTCTLCSLALETTNVLATTLNVSSLKITATSASATYVVDKTTSSQWDTGLGILKSVWIKTAATDVTFISRVDGADETDISALNVIGDSNWHQYKIPTLSGTTSNGYKISVPTDTSIVYIDETEIKPNDEQYVVPHDVTDWTAYTPTITWVSNVDTPIGYYRIIGDSMEIRVSVEGSGTPVTATSLFFDIPSGYTIDSTKIILAEATENFGGWCYTKDDSAGLSYSGPFRFIDGDTDSLRTSVSRMTSHSGTTYLDMTSVGSTVPFTFDNNDTVICTASFPIVGSHSTSSTIVTQKSITDGDKAGFVQWSSGDITESDTFLKADGRCVLESDYPDFFENVGETYGDCTVTTSGDGMYLPDLITGNRYIRASGGSIALGLQQADATDKNGLSTASAGNHRHGTTLDGRTGGISGSSIGPYWSSEHISKGSKTAYSAYDGTHSHTISSSDSETRPITIAFIPYVRMANVANVIMGKFENINSSDLVKVKAYQSAGTQTIANITWDDIDWVETQDNTSSFASNTFTAPRASDYMVCAKIMTQAIAFTAGKKLRMLLDVDVGSDVILDWHEVEAAITANIAMGNCYELPMAEGETLQIDFYHDNGGTVSFEASAAYNWLSITEVPDTESIIKNMNDNKKIECQTKFLTADVTTDTTVSDLQFTGLTVGKKYEICQRGRGYFGAAADNIGFFSEHDSSPILEVTLSAETNRVKTNHDCVKFTATTTTLEHTTISIASGNAIVGNSTISETYAELCELNDNYVFTSKF